jgi:hypothetical protein
MATHDQEQNAAQSKARKEFFTQTESKDLLERELKKIQTLLL